VRSLEAPSTQSLLYIAAWQRQYDSELIEVDLCLLRFFRHADNLLTPHRHRLRTRPVNLPCIRPGLSLYICSFAISPRPSVRWSGLRRPNDMSAGISLHTGLSALLLLLSPGNEQCEPDFDCVVCHGPHAGTRLEPALRPLRRVSLLPLLHSCNLLTHV
jgi:hypothetical protein